jgi:hypothetical protein
LLTTYTVTPVTPGVTYSFTVRANNIYGNGAFSTALPIIAIDVPSKLVIAATVTLDTNSPYTNLIVSWIPPTTHSSAIVAYNILFKKADGTYDVLSACDGTTSTIVTNHQCTVSMANVLALTS